LRWERNANRCERHQNFQESGKNKFRKTDDGKLGADLNEPNLGNTRNRVPEIPGKIDVEEYHGFRDSRGRNFFLPPAAIPM